MKKLIILSASIILLVSCTKTEITTHPESSKIISTSRTEFFEFPNFDSLLRKFRFDPSAIYGSVFSNQAWH